VRDDEEITIQRGLVDRFIQTDSVYFRFKNTNRNGLIHRFGLFGFVGILFFHFSNDLHTF